MGTSSREHRRLVLISGAVASGKTTLAWRLAALSREQGVPAAAIDIDELVATVAGRDWSLVTRAHRSLACELVATVVQRLFERDVRFIAVAGSTVSSYEWHEVSQHLTAAPPATCVLLRVSLAEAVRRARPDPARVATCDPEVLARLHSAIDWAGVPQPDIQIATDELNADEVAEAVWSSLQREVNSSRMKGRVVRRKR